MSASLAGFDAEFTQLAPAAVVGEHGLAVIGSTLLQSGRTLVPLLQRGATPALPTFYVVMPGSIPMVSRGCENHGDRILITRAGEELYWRTPTDFSILAVSVDEAALRRVASELDMERGIDMALRSHSIRPAVAELLALRRELGWVAASAFGSAPRAPDLRLFEPRLIRSLVVAIGSCARCVDPARSQQRDHVVLGVEAALAGRPEHAFTREELSKAAGTSGRTVRRAIQTWFGLPPLKLARIRRLHRARRALRDGTPTGTRVIDVAVRFGFSHLSRFAGEYRALFGELPSQTLCQHATRGHRVTPT